MQPGAAELAFAFPFFEKHVAFSAPERAAGLFFARAMKSKNVRESWGMNSREQQKIAQVGASP